MARSRSSATRRSSRRGGNPETRQARLILAGAVVLSAVILTAWFPAGALFHQHKALASASGQLTQLTHQDASLSQQRTGLNNSAEVGRIAREQYQLVMPGQQAYEVLPPAGSASVAAGASASLTTPAATHTAVQPDHGGAGGFVERVVHSLEILALSEPGAGDIPSPADVDIVAGLLGRVPSGDFRVVVRRPDGQPMVIANDPLLRDGTPMPTRFWLVDPDIRARVGHLESIGGVREAEARVDAGALETAHARYARERDAHIQPAWTGPRPSGGVGGTRQGVKCLHAHVAWWLAGGEDPVGDWVAAQLDLRRVAGGVSPA